MMGAKPREGSSSMSSWGMPIMARASAHIWRSPPDKRPASWPRLSAKMGKYSITSCNLAFMWTLALS